MCLSPKIIFKTTFLLFSPQSSFYFYLGIPFKSGVRIHTNEEIKNKEIEDAKEYVSVLDQVVSGQKIWTKVIFL